MTRMSNGADIPVQVSGYQNKLMIMPLVNINTFTSGEAIRVITKNIADVYGNTSTVFDTLISLSIINNLIFDHKIELNNNNVTEFIGLNINTSLILRLG